MFGLLQEGRDQIDAKDRPEDKEGGQLKNAVQHLHALHLFADSQRGEQHHEDDADQVLDHEYADDDTGELLVTQAHLVECLEDDRCR